MDIEIKQQTIEFKPVKLRAIWNPTFQQDLLVYRENFVYRKKPKRDSWRIKRLKKKR